MESHLSCYLCACYYMCDFGDFDGVGRTLLVHDKKDNN
jgi:hypothetical protein